MRTLTPSLEMVVKFKGAIPSSSSSTSNPGAHVQYPLTAHDQFNQLMWQLVIFLTASVDILLTGDATNRTVTAGVANTSYFASWIKLGEREGLEVMSISWKCEKFP